MKQRTFATAAYCLFSLILLGACGRDEIEVHRLPKAIGAAASDDGAGDGGSGPRWTAPTGWAELPGDGMRAASFVLPKGNGTAEATVVALPGDVGGELANVNRWRGQISLPAIDEAALAAARTKVKTGAGEALLFDFSGAKPPKRLIAAMLRLDGTTWFFKLSGDSAAVSAQRKAFLDMVKGLKPR